MKEFGVEELKSVITIFN